MLRDAAAGFRRAAATEADPQLSILAASLLEQRAERIAGGEDDHSDLPVDIGSRPEQTDLPGVDPEDPTAPEEEPQSRAG